MWRVVVVLNMYTKFREKIVGKVYHTGLFRTTTTRDMVSFIDVYFPFSSKFPNLNFGPYVLYIYPCYETRTAQTVSLGYLWFPEKGMRHYRLFCHGDFLAIRTKKNVQPESRNSNKVIILRGQKLKRHSTVTTQTQKPRSV